MDFSSSEDLKVSATDTYREIGTHRQQRTRTITVDITNDTSKDVSGHRMRIPADKHFLSGVSEPIGLITAYGGTARMTVKTTSRPGASIDNLMGEFTINFRNEDDSRTVLSKTFTDMYLRAWDGLKVFNPDDPAAVAKFNILLFGWAGAGKSSLLQSIMTLLTESREVLKNAVTVGGGQDHVTTDIRYTDLNKFGIHANLVDTWGMDGDNYTGKTLSMLCQGLLPSGWGMMQNMGQDEAAKIARGAATREQRQIHCVLFCLPHAMIENEADMANIAGQFQELVRQGINPIVLLSRIDEVVPDVRDDPMGTHDGVETLRATVAAKLSIPASRVLPMVPYVDENQRDVDKDRLINKLLNQALRSASEFRALGDIDVATKGLDFDVGGGISHGRVHDTGVGKSGTGAGDVGGTAPVVDAATAKLLAAMGIVAAAPAAPPSPPSFAAPTRGAVGGGGGGEKQTGGGRGSFFSSVRSFVGGGGGGDSGGGETKTAETKTTTTTSEDTCAFCRKNAPEMALVPCGHKCLCKTCDAHAAKMAGASGSRACPICRQVVKASLRVF